MSNGEGSELLGQIRGSLPASLVVRVHRRAGVHLDEFTARAITGFIREQERRLTVPREVDWGEEKLALFRARIPMSVMHAFELFVATHQMERRFALYHALVREFPASVPPKTRMRGRKVVPFPGSRSRLQRKK